MSDYVLLHGNSLEILKELDDNSIDSVVTDPPYGLGKEPDANLVLKDWIEKGYHEIKSKGGFMGKEWDSFVPQPELWKEVFRVLKPGGHVLSFFGTRTYDWGVMAMRLAGFEIRDCIQWLYGSGFPKSHNISKAIDSKLGCERKVVSEKKTNSGGMAHISKTNAEHGFRPNEYNGHSLDSDSKNVIQETEPSSKQAKQWDGWGTALKPANEPIVLARKPLIGTVVENVLEHGVGGINIDGCRISHSEEVKVAQRSGRANASVLTDDSCGFDNTKNNMASADPKGRFPANVILDEEAGSVLDQQTGTFKSGSVSADGFKGEYSGSVFGKYANNSIDPTTVYADSGGASRFFYCAKTSQKERNEGMIDGKNIHPTVKPIALMQYLIRLITPPNGTVLDPFNGSGSTGCAAMLENMTYIGIEMEEESIKTSEQRIEHYKIEMESKQTK